MTPDRRRNATDAHLLVGADDRWQPSRCGVVNAWQYGEEVLELDSGRLLLHGPNGSGKTMLLEMLWPFLLDTSTRPSRLSTGGTERGTLAGRLTGYTSGQARTSFLWAEFTRRGTDERFTIGARCRVPASGGSVDRCWFTTDQRIGEDLRLLDHEQRPISIDALREQIDTNGTVWGGDESGYRRTVRQRLFTDHTEESVDRLIDTILVVRQKEITSRIAKSGSARAQAQELASLLTAALPSLDEQQVSRAADGFERLDRRRDAIDELVDQQRVLAALDVAASKAARIQLLRTAVTARTAQTELDKVTRAERTAEEELHEATAARDRLDRELADAEQRQLDTSTKLMTLKSSDAYAAAERLVSLSEKVQGLHRLRVAADQLVTDRARARDDAARLVGQDEGDLHQADEQLADAVDQLVAVAEDARIDLDRADVVDGADGLAEIMARLDRRGEEVARVREALDAHAAAVGVRDRAEQARDEANTARDEALAQRDACRDHLATALAVLRSELDRWAATRRHVAIRWPDHLLDTADGAVDADPDTLHQAIAALQTTIREAVQEAVADVHRRLEVRGQRLGDAVAGARQQVADAAARLRELHAGVTPPPVAPSWRAPRIDRAGGPLYGCIDVRDPDATTANAVIETVLARTGLLDAWVEADGVVVLDDVTLRGRDVPQPEGWPGGTLADVLTADPGSPVAADVVMGLLEGIGLVDADAESVHDGRAMVVGRDGSWRLGPTVGRTTAEPATHIGTAARERRRLQLILETEHEHARYVDLVAALEADRAEIAAERRATDAEVSTLPTTDPLPVMALRDADVRLSDAVVVAQRAMERVGQAATDVRLRLTELSQHVAATGLPGDGDVLDAVQLAVRDGRSLIGTVQIRSRAAAAIRTRLEGHRRAVEEHRARLDTAEDDARAAGREHHDAQVQLETLEATVGADAAEVRTRASELEAQEIQLRTNRIPTLRTQTRAERDRVSKADMTLSQSTERRETAEVARTAAFDTLRQAVDVGVAVDAGVRAGFDLDTIQGLRTAVTTICRQLEAARTPTSDAAWTDATNQMTDQRYQARETIARHSLDPEVVTIGSLVVLRVSKDGRRLRLDEVQAELDAELEVARAELGEAEETAFRATLTGALRAHLAERLRTATSMVEAMNRVLSGISTQASQVTVSLRWIVDPTVDTPDAVSRFRGLLLTDAPSDAERAEMYAFLRRRIEQLEAQAGAVEDLGSWATRLGQILDYRAWHTFEVVVGHAGRPTPTTFGNRKLALSTGEHALVLVLPLLAAVTAHYLPRGSTASQCPRLLVMDEVFPTVDAENKRQLFGLMSALDLDYVMTSDKEWCTYDTVDGIAIHSVQKDGDESFTTRFTWDGRERRSAPVAGGGDSPRTLL